MKTLGMVNQKGGSGKTATAVTLAALWADQGRPILAVGSESQVATSRLTM